MEQFKEQYKKLQDKVNYALKEFFTSEDGNFKAMGPEAYQSFERIKDFSFRGGKVLRPILAIKGFELFNGPKEHSQDILNVSIYAELLHNYLLVHDDIMDKDDTRRGGKTIHTWYRDEDFNHLTAEDAKHYGISIGIIDGDILEALAQKAILNSKFPDNLKVRALKEYSETVIKTGIGQKLDVLTNTKQVDEDYIKKIHLLKSAEYTITRPLKIGAILAGASEAELEKLICYGENTGLAFQLRDDELGLSPNELGKSKNDLAEGKQTIILLKAIENNPDLPRQISAALDKGDLSDVITEIEETGALNYNHKLAWKYGDKAIQNASTELLKLNVDVAEFLKYLTIYVVERGR